MWVLIITAKEFHSESQISDAANNSIPSEVRSQQESQPSSNMNIIDESVLNVPDQDEVNENNAISEADLNQSTINLHQYRLVIF